MRSERLSIDYLNDIVDHSEKALRFVHGVSLIEFERNEEKLFAVVRALEVIGEAARHIPKELRDKYPEVPWKKMVGMRDKVIHEYLGVNAETILRTVQEDLPSLRDSLKRIIDELAE